MAIKGGKPVVALTSAHTVGGERERFYVYAAYTHAVQKAGGIPVLLPALHDYTDLDDLLERVDAVLLPGGVDLDPVRFGEEPIRGLGSVDPEWDELELTVAKAALARDMPILGICRGAQVLNVAAGGSLYQDLPTQRKESDVLHYQTAPGWHPTHEVTISAGSVVEGLLEATRIRVNSFHHQAVKVPAHDFDVTARAKDGIAETIESPSHRFAIGIQWHPEYLVDKHPIFTRIFLGLVNAAR